MKNIMNFPFQWKKKVLSWILMLSTFLLWYCLDCGIYNQARRNGFEYGGDNKTPVIFKPFVIQTSQSQFWIWNAKFQNVVEGSIAPNVPAGLITHNLDLITYWMVFASKSCWTKGKVYLGLTKLYLSVNRKFDWA